MRPVRIELKGFTAYRDAQVLPFEHLDLFAVTGPTGSGKSSLLDAMTYALFGKVARVGVQASHLIAQGLPRLSVMFDFDVDGQRYRVTRSTGRRAAQTTVRLERWQGGQWVSFGEGGERASEAKGAVKAKEEVLAGPLVAVDRDTVRQARKRVKKLRASSERMAEVERSLEDLCKTWETERRRIEALGSLREEAEDLSGRTVEVGKALDALSEEVALSQKRLAETEEVAGKAAARAERAAAAQSEAEETLGTLEVLAALRAGLEELARLDARTRSAEDALGAARSAGGGGEEALVVAR